MTTEKDKSEGLLSKIDEAIKENLIALQGLNPGTREYEIIDDVREMLWLVRSRTVTEGLNKAAKDLAGKADALTAVKTQLVAADKQLKLVGKTAQKVAKAIGIAVKAVTLILKALK